MSQAVAEARRGAKIRDLREKHDDVTREFSRVPIGMSGEPSAYLAERRKMLMAEMRSLEDEMAEISCLEGDALVQAFNPPPPELPEELEGMDWTDTLARGARIGSRVVVSVDGRPIAR